MNKKLSLVAFFMFCLMDVLGIYLEKQIIIYIAKPMLMVTLYWYYYLNKKTVNNFYVLGLFFSFFGDVFLLGSGTLYFIIGLLFFLIAHVFYISMVFKLLNKIKWTEVLLSSLLFVTFFFLIIYKLYDGLGDLRIPVIIYAFTISIFGTISMIHYLQRKNKTSIILLMGVIFFIISDTILALNLFHVKQSFYPMSIMITYILAQYLICRFVLKLNKLK